MGLLSRLLRRDSRPLAGGTRVDSWGVSPAQAGGAWVNPASGMGGLTDRAQRDQYVVGPPVDMWLADALLESNAIAYRIAAQEAEDATREGYDLVKPGPRMPGRRGQRLDAGIADAVEEACEAGSDGAGLGLLARLADARTWSRAHGGGALVLLVDDGRPADQPIDRQNIRRVRGILDADRWELPVVEWGRDPHEARTYGKPRIYRLQLNRGGGVPQIMSVHADRVVRIDGVRLPRRRSLVRQGWGGSIFDRVFAPLRQYGTTLVDVGEAVKMLNQGVLTSQALAAGLETEQGMDLFQARLQALRAAMGVYNDVALGPGETYQIHNRSLAGIGDAIKAAVDALVAAADGMPRLVLLGEVTAGFSNASDGELRTWYATVASRQPRIYTPVVRRVIDLVMLSHEGPTGGRLLPYSVEWRPLWAMSETEQAARDLSRAQRRQVDIASGVIDRQEARRDPALVEIYGDLDPMAPLEGMAGDEPPMDEQATADDEDDPVLVEAGPSTAPMPPDLMAPRDAAAMAGISTHKLRRLMRSGALPYWSFGGTDRVSAADLAALGQQHRSPPEP